MVEVLWFFSEFLRRVEPIPLVVVAVDAGIGGRLLSPRCHMAAANIHLSATSCAGQICQIGFWVGADIQG